MTQTIILHVRCDDDGDGLPTGAEAYIEIPNGATSPNVEITINGGKRTAVITSLQAIALRATEMANVLFYGVDNGERVSWE